MVPAQVMVTPTIVPLAEPALDRAREAPDEVVAQVKVVALPPVAKAEAGSDRPVTVISGASWDREMVPKTKPLTAKEAKTAITTVSTVARIGLVALRFSCLRADLPRIDGLEFEPPKACRLRLCAFSSKRHRVSSTRGDSSIVVDARTASGGRV